MAEMLCDTRHPLCFTLSTLLADFVKLAAGIYTTTTADLCLLLKPWGRGGGRAEEQTGKHTKCTALNTLFIFHFLFTEAERRTQTCIHPPPPPPTHIYASRCQLLLMAAQTLPLFLFMSPKAVNHGGCTLQLTYPKKGKILLME